MHGASRVPHACLILARKHSIDAQSGEWSPAMSHMDYLNMAHKACMYWACEGWNMVARRYRCVYVFMTGKFGFWDQSFCEQGILKNIHVEIFFT